MKSSEIRYGNKTSESQSRDTMELAQCQITPSINDSNEEDNLLINAPVIFVGNRRGDRGDGQMVREGLDNDDLLHYFLCFNVFIV